MVSGGGGHKKVGPGSTQEEDIGNSNSKGPGSKAGAHGNSTNA